MTKRKLKPVVVTGIYVVSIGAVVLAMYFMQMLLSKTLFKDNNGGKKYVDDEILDLNRQIPVVSLDKVITKPYSSGDVKIGKSFYNYQAEALIQENSLIYYEGTYMQNSGVDYTSKDAFDVLAAYDGTVVSVKEDNILGKVVEIRHTNDLITVYQALSEVSVKKDDIVNLGQVIGKSGVSNMNKDLGNHLHFELYYQGKVINPEDVFGKKLDELAGN